MKMLLKALPPQASLIIVTKQDNMSMVRNELSYLTFLCGKIKVTKFAGP